MHKGKNKGKVKQVSSILVVLLVSSNAAIEILCRTSKAKAFPLATLPKQ